MWVRTIFVIVAVLLLGTSYAGPTRLPLFGPVPTLRLVAEAAPTIRTSGRLTWLAGARIESDDPLVGGFSALAARGRHFTLLNDGGNFVRFDLGAGGGARGVRFGELPDGPGTGWEKRDRDSESLIVGEDGTMWVGFERANAVWRYAPGFARAEAWARPPTMRRWDANGGPESLVRLRDGRFVAFSEESRWRGQPGLAAVLFAGDPAEAPRLAARFSYLPAPGFAVADAATLPNGDLIVLERRWLLPLRFRSRLALVKPGALKPGALVRGIELGRIVAPWPTENYEGVVATRDDPAEFDA
ncbi:MAG: esterase-like activity of phytase family protein, partial [Rubrivivax sp.]